jgi:hypothetical protein
MAATSSGQFNISALQEKNAEIFNLNIFDYQLKHKKNLMMNPFQY